MAKSWGWLIVIALMIGTMSCQQTTELEQQIHAAATREAALYPWAVYPIGEASKTALCEALALPPQDKFCQPGVAIHHWDVFEKVRDVFPPGTSYAEVEAKLGKFPHIREESRNPDGALVGLRYAYQLTEYEGACIYFDLDLSGDKVREVYATKLDYSSGPLRTKCGPADSRDGESQ
ncbi:MAG: hypothetical protein KKA73_28215 [Chloroflexi bacterium]|nr:hypothetical protein [Chloroflexota bacterium]MBU1751580.1 hypothetical protein [Chloroflexota bacterium]